MKLNTNREIIYYLHRHYYPIRYLSQVRLQEAEYFVRSFKLKKNERIELDVESNGDYFYVMTGSVQMVVDGVDRTVIHGVQSIGKPISIPDTASTIRFNALTECIVCHIANDVMDYLFSWDGIIASHRYEIHPNLYESIDNIRNSLAFQRFPLEYVVEAFSCMKTVHIKKGDEIIRQGEKGDTFYLIKSGRAEVWLLEFESKPEKIGELGKNDSFGEYALLAVQPHNTTVRMLEEGELLVLERSDFLKFFSQTMVREVDIYIAKAMIDSGYQLIDVRFEEEYETLHIPGAILIPLNIFREGMDNLDKNKKYVIQCRSGKRSRVAASLMSVQGFDAVSMQGGIIKWPFEKEGLSV
jgi:rhodanese-related sulfurtransferase